ncbi:MAG: ATP-binding protein [Capsulimonas sp.]|nr:ATP-binding protein [Capsulimonas sp.]
MGSLESPKDISPQHALNQGGLLFERQFPADARIVPQARHDALAICHSSGITDDECASLDLALGEALANAVRHGGSEGLVCLAVWSYQGNLILRVHNGGPGFEPPQPPYPMPAGFPATSGRGLPLMETLTDAMMVCRGDANEGGSSTFLVKHLPEAKTAV